jgi:7-cyano-7-deazaguanine tRNA-ribosyltransferase
MRVHAHPALLSALKRVKKHKDFLETFNPTIKNKGFFYFDHEGLARPEITHYKNRLLNRYTPPVNAKTLLLLPQTKNKPFHKAPEMKKIRQLLRLLGSESADKIHIAVFCAPFGVVPLELDEVYPLSQHEAALPLDMETIEYIAEQTAAYIKQMPYNTVTMLNDSKLWNNYVENAVKEACIEKGIMFDIVEANKGESSRQLVDKLKTALLKQLNK